MKPKRNKHYLIILLLLAGIVSVGVRLYRVTAPVADWHSWRQADTAAVARNFETTGIDLLRPRYDDLSNIQSGKDNPAGWRMVELPVYQVVGVWVHSLFPFITLEVSLRLVSILSTAGSVMLLGYLLSILVSESAAVIGAFVYAVLPFSIYYGRTILPDPFGTFWTLLSLVLLARESDGFRALRTAISAVCAAIALLVRPMEAFMLIPAFIFLVRGEKESVMRKMLLLGLFGVIALAPLYLWRRWIHAFPEGIPVSDWLYNKADIRFKGAWFYWLFANRLGDLILGYWGLIPLAFGFIRSGSRRTNLFSAVWFLGALLYFIVFAGGNVQHDYYQALIIPIVVWFVALGLDVMVRGAAGLNRPSSIAVAVVSVVFLWMFSWYTMRTYFWINRPDIITAGVEADRLLPKNAKVIAPYNGDTTFLYQIRRQGWPLGFDIDQKLAMGAQYYVTVSPTDTDTETRDLAEKYTVLVRNERYAIIDLTKPRALK